MKSYLGKAVLLAGLGLAACNGPSVNRIVDHEGKGRMFVIYSKEDSNMVCSFWDDDYARVKACWIKHENGEFYLENGKVRTEDGGWRRANEDDNRYCVSECGTLKLEYDRKKEDLK